MLRNLNKSAGGRRILGTPYVGLLASQIIVETATGDSGPGLLYDEAQANAGKQLRIRITSLPSAGTLFVRENGDFEFTGAPDGVYSIGYAVDADNVQIKTDTASLTVGAVNGAVGAGVGTGAGSGTGGDAVGQSGTPGVAGGGTGTGTGSGSGGDGVGQTVGAGTVASGTGTGTGSGTGGDPSAQNSANDPGGTGTSTGSGTGGAAIGGSPVSAAIPGASGTGIGSGTGGNAGQPLLSSNQRFIVKAAARRFVVSSHP